MAQDIGPGDFLIANFDDGTGWVVKDRTYICREILSYPVYPNAWHPCDYCGNTERRAILLCDNSAWGYCACIFRKRDGGEEVERQLFQSHKPKVDA